MYRKNGTHLFRHILGALFSIFPQPVLPTAYLVNIEIDHFVPRCCRVRVLYLHSLPACSPQNIWRYRQACFVIFDPNKLVTKKVADDDGVRRYEKYNVRRTIKIRKLIKLHTAQEQGLELKKILDYSGEAIE